MSRNGQKNQQKTQAQKPAEAQVEQETIVEEQEAIVAEAQVVETPAEEKEEVVKHPLLRLAEEYVDLMGVDKAPNKEQIDRGVRLLERVFAAAFFGAEGVEEIREPLKKLMSYARENREVFKTGRMLRGVATGYSKEDQRQMSAYISVFERLVTQGSNAQFPFTNLQVMLGERRATKLRQVTSQVLNVKFL